jgi:hypothetical protein
LCWQTGKESQFEPVDGVRPAVFDPRASRLKHKEAQTMKTATFAAAWTALARRLIVGAVLAAGAVIVALFVNAGGATAWAQPTHPHTGPDYISITGARIGAPSEQEVSNYGGSHKHSWVEQQLYGPGVVAVPHVDTSVQQSR